MGNFFPAISVKLNCGFLLSHGHSFLPKFKANLETLIQIILFNVLKQKKKTQKLNPFVILVFILVVDIKEILKSRDFFYRQTKIQGIQSHNTREDECNLLLMVNFRSRVSFFLTLFYKEYVLHYD